MTRLFDVASARPRRSWRSLPVSLVLHGAGGALLLSLQMLAPLELPEVQPPGPLVFRPATAVVQAASLPAAATRRPATTPIARRAEAPVTARPATQAAPSVIPDGLPAPDAVAEDPALANPPFGSGCTGPGCTLGLTGGGAPGPLPEGEGGGEGEGPARPLVAGREVTPPLKLHDVRPLYPDLALRARVQGSVELTCTIAPDGRVVDARVHGGPPLLRDAALAAVLQWRYRPTRVDGVPVPVLLSVTVHFRLGR